MRLLLDTHTFLWFAAGDASLSSAARKRIEDRAHEKFVSLASIWEIAIKVSVGKIELACSVHDLVQTGAVENGIQLLDIKRDHLLAIATLLLHRRDPFDRLLVAQALAEGMAVVGKDAHFDAYRVRRIR